MRKHINNGGKTGDEKNVESWLNWLKWVHSCKCEETDDQDTKESVKKTHQEVYRLKKIKQGSSNFTDVSDNTAAMMTSELLIPILNDMRIRALKLWHETCHEVIPRLLSSLSGSQELTSEFSRFVAYLNGMVLEPNSISYSVIKKTLIPLSMLERRLNLVLESNMMKSKDESFESTEEKEAFKENNIEVLGMFNNIVMELQAAVSHEEILSEPVVEQLGNEIAEAAKHFNAHSERMFTEMKPKVHKLKADLPPLMTLGWDMPGRLIIGDMIDKLYSELLVEVQGARTMLTFTMVNNEKSNRTFPTVDDEDEM